MEGRAGGRARRACLSVPQAMQQEQLKGVPPEAQVRAGVGRSLQGICRGFCRDFAGILQRFCRDFAEILREVCRDFAHMCSKHGPGGIRTLLIARAAGALLL